MLLIAAALYSDAFLIEKVSKLDSCLLLFVVLNCKFETTSLSKVSNVIEFQTNQYDCIYIFCWLKRKISYRLHCGAFNRKSIFVFESTAAAKLSWLSINSWKHGLESTVQVSFNRKHSDVNIYSRAFALALTWRINNSKAFIGFFISLYGLSAVLKWVKM